MLITPLHRLEFSHAVAQQVFRKSLSQQEARRIKTKFQLHSSSNVWKLVDLPPAAFPAGIALAEAHVASLGNRSLDTLHVASALELGAKEFWTFDDRQVKLAKAVGLRVS